VIDAPLVEGKVSEFCERAREALERFRIVASILGLAGVVTTRDESPPDPPLIQSQMHKGLFVEDSRFVGADIHATDVGRKSARLQLRALLRPMEDVGVREAVSTGGGDGRDAEDFVEQLRGVVANAARCSETTFVAVLIPIAWQLSQAMGLSFLRTAAPPDEWALSEGAAREYAGLFEEVPVFQFPEVPRDVVYVVDLSRYLSAEAWLPSEAVTVTVLSEEEARERARQDPGRDEIGEDEIVRRWRETALVTVDPGLRLGDERDESAVVVLRVPASLTRDVG
jgi:hypothetical protein